MIILQDEILARLGWSRSTLLRRRQDGSFSAPVNPNEKPLRWSLAAFENWLDDDANHPPSAIDQMIARKYPDELQQAIDDCQDEVNTGVDEDYADYIKDQVHEVVARTLDNYRDDALEDALVEMPDAAEDEVEERGAALAYERANAAAYQEVIADLAEEIATRKSRLARREAMAYMHKWLRKGKRDD